MESGVGIGTTFGIYLPRIAGTAAARPEFAAPLNALKGTETILLVEDEESVRKLIKNLLERNGYVVHMAASGLRALDVWREHKGTIDVLVTDMVMPEGIGGHELGRRLQEDDPKLRVIYCSGYNNHVYAGGVTLRANETFLEKPFSLNVLLQLIRDCLKPAV